MNRSWIYVVLTCCFELLWIYGFKVAALWWHWMIIIGIIIIDFYFLSEACAGLPTGSVYAIFAGIGTIGTALMDVVLFGGSLSTGKIIFIILLLSGVIGLKLADQVNSYQADDSNQKRKGVN